MKLSATVVAGTFLAGSVSANPLQKRGTHTFTLVNKCGSAVTPKFADTRCGYSPRCSDATAFGQAQPAAISAGQSISVAVPERWVGRVFNNNGHCGASGENCSIGEFNLDTGDQFTPQAYDISNIQGFTQSMSISAAGCETVTCSAANCPCNQAYPVGDTTGCGNDSPVRGCGAGDVAFTVTFCP